MELHPFIEKRYSPRSFAQQPITEHQVDLLLEAAHRAPSAGNLQPWRFVFAHRGEEGFEAIAGTLTGNNRLWAPNAPLLMVAIAEDHFENGTPHAVARYDTGTATAWMTVQATYMNMYVHQMGGFEHDRLHSVLGLPERFRPVVVMAVGYLGNPEDLSTELPEGHRVGETRRSGRKPLHDIAFHGTYGAGVKVEEVVL